MKKECMQRIDDALEAPEVRTAENSSPIDKIVQTWRNEGYSDKEIMEFIEILQAPD